MTKSIVIYLNLSVSKWQGKEKWWIFWYSARWISILGAGTCIYRPDQSLTRKHLPSSSLCPSGSLPLSVLLCYLSFLKYILLPVGQPPSLSSSLPSSFAALSVLSHTFSLSVSDSLSDLYPPEHVLEADWLQPARQLCVVGLVPPQRRFG